MRRRVVLLLMLYGLALSSGPAIGQPSSVDEARRLYNRAAELHGAGRHDEAVPLAERALAAFENAFGPEHPDVALSLNGLALVYKAKGAYARAEPLFLRALAIYSKLAGRSAAATKNVATTLNNLAELHKAKGDYTRAEPLYERALQIYVKVLGAENESVATTVNNLAELHRARGDYARAEPLYLRALALYQKVLGPEHPDVALALSNLGALYYYKGDYARAEPLYLRALAIREKTLGPMHPDVANSLSNLAELSRKKGGYARAESLYHRALTIRVKLHPEHPDVALSLNNLAALYLLEGGYALAEPLFMRAWAINVKAFGPDHLEVARSLHNLAALYQQKGDHARAEPLYQRALVIREKVLGPAHPTVAVTLVNLADLYRGLGDHPRAVQFNRRALEIEERNLGLIFASGSEDQKQLYLDTLRGGTNSTISFHVRSAPTDEQAARLALTTVLRRKGRALDAMTDQIAALRQRAAPQDRQLLDQLTSARSELARLQVSGSGRLTPEAQQAERSRLDAAIQHLEDQVGRRSAEFRALVQPVTLDAVGQALPADAALVEIVAYRPFNAAAAKASERFGPTEYVAYVLKRHGTPQFVELGATESIDATVGTLRAALQDPKRGDVKDLSRALDERVMRPVRRLLGATRHVFLSPDGALNLLPFAALVDEGGRYLVEEYTISYLTSGRDLLRLHVPRTGRGAPLVMGNPLYDMPIQPARPTAVGAQPTDSAMPRAPHRRSVDFASLTFDPLPGTAGEARALQALLPGARVLLQQQATEAALKRVQAPRVLHIATHGFFLPDQPGDHTDEGTPGQKGSHQGVVPRRQQENPLMRSGLVFAGVQQQHSGPDQDGVLTALEAASLNLWGTQLVVLSACETGLGEVRNGAGVYGLRRALVLAGSETQMMSLWAVDDEATRDLMVAFYTRLQAGEGRADALRQVQLAMLSGSALNRSEGGRGPTGNAAHTPSRHHPFYWAPFIQSGGWTSMSGQ
jgi:CHAT domain-containing protein/Tfp pilus assembly protein PilF